MLHIVYGGHLYFNRTVTTPSLSHLQASMSRISLYVADRPYLYQDLTSDNEFLARIFDCWKAEKIFSVQHLDLNLQQQDL